MRSVVGTGNCIPPTTKGRPVQSDGRQGETVRGRARSYLVGGALLWALVAAQPAAAASFNRRTVVTVDRNQVPGVASLTDFPVLVSVTSVNLRTTANGGFVTSSLGHDIVFQGEDAPTCAPAAPPCRLDHEIESYDGVSGSLVAWVRVPAVFGSLSGADTPIYMYYGDATITCSQQNKQGVWDASYREVFHFHESGDHADSTANGFTAVRKGAVTAGAAGKVGPALDFQGAAAAASLNVSDGTLPTGTSLTFEAWVNFRSYVAGRFVGIAVKGREALNFDGDADPGGGFCTLAPCGDWVGLYNGYNGASNVFSLGWPQLAAACKVGNLNGPAPILTNQWYHVAGSYAVGGLRRLYVDGAQVAVDGAAGACIEAAIPHYMRLGNDDNFDDYLDGFLDELRVSWVARSASWIEAGYNNQSNPVAGGFYSSVAHQSGSWTVGATACLALNPCAGGPGTCYRRSIGNTASYTTGSGSCTATNASSVVSCPGAGWQSANRGRGDRIDIDGTNYMVLAVDSETQLRLTAPFTGVTGIGNKSYTMSRQFATLQAWEDCISGAAVCPYGFTVADGNLVTGNRSEVGIVYEDAIYTTGAGPFVTLLGSTTDASHTITLTADGSNRHYGVSGAGVVLDNQANATRAVVIQDQHVTVEWLEVRNGGDPGAIGIDILNSASRTVVRNNLIRNCSSQSIRVGGTGSNGVVVADINNNIVYRGLREGIRVSATLDPGSQVRIFNNTLLRNNGATAQPNTEISTAERPNPYVVLRNNVFVDDAQSPDTTWNGLALCTNAANCDWWNAASGNNITGDAAPPTGKWFSDIGPNPRGGGFHGSAEASLNFVNTTAGSENLHLLSGSQAWNAGSALTGLVLGDVDAQTRSALWDIGADELPATAAPPLIAYSDFAAAGTRPLQFTTYGGGAWSAPGTTAVTGSPPFHNQALHQKSATTSPNGTRRAVVWSEHNPGGRDYLYASFWDGTNWDDGAGAPFADAQTGFFQPGWDGLLDVRNFDAAYEQLSGRLLVALGSNTIHTLRYRRYDSGVWSAETSTGIPAASFGGANAGQDGYFTWVRLAPRPGTNQIAVLNLETQASLTPTYGAVTAAIWDGNTATWGSKVVLSFPTTNGQNGHLTEAGDIKFVLGGANAGEAIAVWGNGQQLYANRWSQAGGWSGSVSIANLGAGNTVRWVRLAAKPQGDRMVVAVGDTNQRILTVAYNATTRVWGALSAAHTTTAFGNALYNRPFDLLFDPSSGSGNVVVAYSDTTGLRYRVSTDDGASWSAQQTLTSSYQAYWLRLERDPSNVVHMAIADQADDLRAWNGAGVSFSVTTPVLPSSDLERGTNHSVEPFALATYPPQGAATTAVRLMSFSATGKDAAVELAWQTGSELDNLGFHLYRGPSSEGPWTRLTSTLVPGLGSSPVGKSYAWRDSGLVNGQRYYYRLEDVDTASVSTFHGPVSAVPEALPPVADGGKSRDGGGSGDADSSTNVTGACPSWVRSAYEQAAPSSSPGQPRSAACAAYGQPEQVSLRVLSRSSSSAVVELLTGGFYAVDEGGGQVRVFVPGFELAQEASAPALPVRRALVDAVVGRQVRLVSERAEQLHAFRGLRPASVGAVQMSVAWDGTVRPSRRAAAAPRESRGYLPLMVSRLAGTVFQGEAKSAVLELSPLRYDARRRQLVLARRVVVRLAFSGREPGEVGSGTRGRVKPKPAPAPGEVLAELFTAQRGLHAVGFEDLPSPRGVPVGALRLQRQGQAVPFRVEPAHGVFGPGSVLYFHADAASSSSAYSAELAYELLSSDGGAPMTVVAGRPAGPSLAGLAPTRAVTLEVNRVYQPGLLAASDLWLWDGVASGAVRTRSFTLSGVDGAASLPVSLEVHLQGGSESGLGVDHHVRVNLNGIDVGEAVFAGKQPYRLDASVSASLLREGSNELSVVNVGDTGVASLVFLDRLTLYYPQTPLVRAGGFEGSWGQSGAAEVAGAGASPLVVDVSGPVAWLDGVEVTPQSVRFRAEAGHRYVVAAREGLLKPRVARPWPTSIRATGNQADLLLVGPASFLAAAEPLLERRRSQGLRARAVSLEEVASAFGHAESSGEAIREFVSYAYHNWSRPSPRYLLLVGDSSYDPRNFMGTSPPSPLPALWVKTSYLVTASDPGLGAVNGDDLIPDLAVGRLPATTPEQAEQLVRKILDWEDTGQGLAGAVALVADNPDAAGDFEADAHDIASSYLQGRDPRLIFLSQLGAGTRPAILDAFDQGLSLISYVGHGGAAVWASENVLNSWDAPSLRAQSRQPLLLTMNCLNGYFVAPGYESLAEALLKLDGRGAVAAFSPSGLSLDGPAHQYHRALMAELTSGRHERLGDAILAAQQAYAHTGLMPELLGVYHLFADPALKLRAATQPSP